MRKRNRLKGYFEKAGNEPKSPPKDKDKSPTAVRPILLPKTPEPQDGHPPHEIVIPKLGDVRFPCLMIEQTKGTVIFANANGVGMVIRQGESRVLRYGDVILWVQKWFHYEDLTFVPMPDCSQFTIRNLFSI